MNITIQGAHLELTDELRAYVQDKLSDALRSFGAMDLEPVSVNVELEQTTRHHRRDARLFRAEATVSVPGQTIRAEASAESLYDAIVDMKHILARNVDDWRATMRTDAREGARYATTPAEEGEPPLEPYEDWQE